LEVNFTYFDISFGFFGLDNHVVDKTKCEACESGVDQFSIFLGLSREPGWLANNSTKLGKANTNFLVEVVSIYFIPSSITISNKLSIHVFNPMTRPSFMHQSRTTLTHPLRALFWEPSQILDLISLHKRDHSSQTQYNLNSHRYPENTE
jgi:hypothetical protein